MTVDVYELPQPTPEGFTYVVVWTDRAGVEQRWPCRDVHVATAIALGLVHGLAPPHQDGLGPEDGHVY